MHVPSQPNSLDELRNTHVRRRIELCGKSEIVSYNDDEKQPWTIMIPCIHPGMDMYNPHHGSPRQVLEITLWIVPLTVSIAGEEFSKTATFNLARVIQAERTGNNPLADQKI